MFGVELVACLATAHTAAQAAERLDQDAAFVEAGIGLLRAADLVLPAADNGETAEDLDGHARGWEFHDLVMHGAESHVSSRPPRRGDLSVREDRRYDAESPTNPPSGTIPSRARGRRGALGP